MFKYEYAGNIHKDKWCVEFHGKWQRFHYCKAAVMHLKEYEFGLHGDYVHESWLFMSYSTPILYISRMYHLGTGSIIGYDVIWNNDYFRCSKTTIQQLSRFLNELEERYGVGISYIDLKQFDKQRINPIERGGNVYHLKPISNSEIEEYISYDVCANDSPYWCYRI